MQEVLEMQLSSSALERLAARRTFPLHRRTSVCRNLFGPVDHDELSREMTTKMREISERDQQRWNFNFDANTPLGGGDYQWEEVPAVEAPQFYQESVQNGRSRVVVAAVPATPVKQQRDSGVQEMPSSSGTEVLERLAPAESSGTGTSPPCQVNQENRTDKINSGKNRTSHRLVPCQRRKRAATTDNNTQITDFFVKRKRVVDIKSDKSPCHVPKSPIPVEHTPRKRIR